MEVFYYDFLWSGLTYVILTYLAFRLMRNRKRRNDGDDGDQGKVKTPKIDLPPGVVWPKDYISEPEEKEEVLA